MQVKVKGKIYIGEYQHFIYDTTKMCAR